MLQITNVPEFIYGLLKQFQSNEVVVAFSHLYKFISIAFVGHSVFSMQRQRMQCDIHFYRLSFYKFYIVHI